MTPFVLRLGLYLGCLLAVGCGDAGRSAASDTASKGVEGTVEVPAFQLPVSKYLSPHTRELMTRPRTENTDAKCLSIFESANLTTAAMADIRACLARQQQSLLQKFKSRFGVTMTDQRIGDVPTVVYLPKGGVLPAHKNKVLINLHGGAFVIGTSWPESMPIAAASGMKVIGVDYRMGPEHKFPAASEDVAAVYRAVLQDYAPANVGIYGCSAGGKLTAQAVAWFRAHRLPRPGAVGLFGTGAESYVDGDSAHIGSALTGIDLFGPGAKALMKAYAGDDPDYSDPLLSPLSSMEVMAEFPPTLVISSTRDWGLSNAVHTHARLIKLGVPADLHVWEGLGHCFFAGDPDMPEAQEAYDVVARFFTKHLGAGASD